MSFDHAEIRRTMDRDASEALFAVFVDPETSDEEFDEVVASLGYVDDPRLSARLRELVFDNKAADRIRVAAYDAIEHGSDYFTDYERRAIWEGGNPALMDRVLGSLRDQHIVLPIASDPAHPLHARAIDALAFNFEAHQGLAIAAMLHHDPAVRRAGVTTLLWEEPTDAVPGLLVCLDDDDTGVRHEAENTLQYFPDRRVLRRLVGSQGETFASLLDDFASSLMSNPALADWMRDVLDVVEPMLVSLSDDDAPPAAEGQALRENVDVPWLIAALTDLGGSWSDRRKRIRSSFDWATVPTTNRPALVELFQTHPDPDVRVVGTYALAAWDTIDELLAMIDDCNHSVSKSAIYTLAKATPNTQVGARLLAILQSGDRAVSSFGELLGSFVHHADPLAAERFLVSTIESSALESVQRDCLSALIELEAHAAIDSLAHLLSPRPRVTWNLHVALLENYTARRTPVDNLPDLESVDDLRMAEALVRYRRSRDP